MPLLKMICHCVWCNTYFSRRPDTRLQPQVKMPDVLEPEQEFKVTVSENSGKSMTYSLAVVEEGLLDLTRYKTLICGQSF